MLDVAKTNADHQLASEQANVARSGLIGQLQAGQQGLYAQGQNALLQAMLGLSQAQPYSQSKGTSSSHQNSGPSGGGGHMGGSWGGMDTGMSSSFGSGALASALAQGQGGGGWGGGSVPSGYTDPFSGMGGYGGERYDPSLYNEWNPWAAYGEQGDFGGGY